MPCILKDKRAFKMVLNPEISYTAVSFYFCSVVIFGSLFPSPAPFLPSFVSYLPFSLPLFLHLPRYQRLNLLLLLFFTKLTPKLSSKNFDSYIIIHSTYSHIPYYFGSSLFFKAGFLYTVLLFQVKHPLVIRNCL